MKVANEIKKPTSVDLGINALYLIATLPEEQNKKYQLMSFHKFKLGFDFMKIAKEIPNSYSGTNIGWKDFAKIYEGT